MEHYEDELQQRIRQAIREERSVRMNGDSFKQWRSKVITFDRVVWFVTVGVFIAGMRWQQYQTDLTDTMEKVSELAAAQVTFVKDLSDFRGLMQRYEGLLQTENSHATKSDLAKVENSLEDSLARTIKRDDWQSMWRLQVFPRLDRLEKQHAQEVR